MPKGRNSKEGIYTLRSCDSRTNCLAFSGKTSISDSNMAPPSYGGTSRTYISRGSASLRTGSLLTFGHVQIWLASTLPASLVGKTKIREENELWRGTTKTKSSKAMGITLEQNSEVLRRIKPFEKLGLICSGQRKTKGCARSTRRTD